MRSKKNGFNIFKKKTEQTSRLSGKFNDKKCTVWN